jgi:hypothetical protein
MNVEGEQKNETELENRNAEENWEESLGHCEFNTRACVVFSAHGAMRQEKLLTSDSCVGNTNHPAS